MEHSEAQAAAILSSLEQATPTPTNQERAKLRRKLQRSTGGPLQLKQKKSKKRDPRHRNWLFTANNYTDADVNRLLERPPPTSYAVWGFETGEQGTPHLQGYMEFVEQMSLQQCKNLYSQAWHWEPRRGTQQEAINYCTKDGIYQEVGTRKRQVCPNCFHGIYLDLTEHYE